MTNYFEKIYALTDINALANFGLRGLIHHGGGALIKSTTIIALMLLSNTAIAIIALPELKRNINYYSVTWFIIFMSAVWEVTLVMRLYIA